MKRLLIQSFLVFASISLMAFSCDKAKDLAIVTSDQTFSTSFTLKSSATSGNYSTGFKKMDLSEVEKYGDKLQDVMVNKVTYEITNNNSSNPTADLNIRYSNSADGSGTVFNLKSLSNVSAAGEVDLGLDQATLDNLAEFIKNLNEDVYLEGDGSFTGGPVDATFTITVYGTIKANPLN